MSLAAPSAPILVAGRHRQRPLGETPLTEYARPGSDTAKGRRYSFGSVLM